MWSGKYWKIRNKIIILASCSIIILALLLSGLNIVNMLTRGQADITGYEKETLQNIRFKLRDLVETVKEMVESRYRMAVNNKLSTEEMANVRETMKEIISNFRYDSSGGYFWINDTTRPVPKMVMHPISPELDGRVMDNPAYNTAGEEKRNLFVVFSEIARMKGAGYVSYSWPKPTKDGLSEFLPKESYLTYFEPWDWVIGTGVYVDDIHAKIEGKKQELSGEITGTIVSSLILTVCITIGLIVIISIILNRITKAINVLVAMSRRIAEGDFSMGDENSWSAYTDRNDETGFLMKNFHNLVENIRNSLVKTNNAVVNNVKEKDELLDIAAETAAAALNITDNMDNINSNVAVLVDETEDVNAHIVTISGHIKRLNDQIGEQVAMVEESSASIHQITASLGNVADITMLKQQSSQQLLETVGAGGMQLGAMLEVTKDLLAKMGNINEMTSLIAKMAGQTNLLSMNAAIEAAHAGDTGKGFAVVAEEIRKLADTSRTSSKMIRSVIREMMEIAGRAASSGTETMDAFRQIETEVKDVSNAFTEIQYSTTELNSGAEQIQESMVQLGSLSGSVSERYGEIDSASEELQIKSGHILETMTTIRDKIARTSEAVSKISGSVTDIRSISLKLDEITGELNSAISRYRLA